MKPLSKKTVRIALLLCVAGLLIMLASFIAVGFDVKKLETVVYETNTYEITDYFTDITVKTQTADLCFVPWEEEHCKVVCYEEEKVKHTVTVQKNTLVIDVTDTREWYEHMGMSFEAAELTVYLPKKQYDALEIEGDTGDVELPEDFTFEKGKVKTDTGKITWKATVINRLVIETDTGKVNVDTDTFERLEIKTSTGDVSVDSVAVAYLVSVETGTGEILLNNINCRSFSVETNTGKVYIKDTVAGLNGTILTQTGDVTFEDSDAVESLYIKTDTGDVTGTLLSGKQFQTETDTGRVSVPATNGYPCVIITDTGDINIEVVGE